MKESQRNEILAKASKFTFKSLIVTEKFNKQLSYVTTEWYSKHRTDETEPISYQEMEQGVSDFIEKHISVRLIDIFKDTYTEVPGRQMEYAIVSSSVENMISNYKKDMKAKHDQRLRDRQRITKIPDLVEEPTYNNYDDENQFY